MSWFANTITTLKVNLFASENDGDTEDDTHVCRVLRAYYNEKGRPLPPWLPPDPKAPAPPSVAQAPSFSSSRYGGFNTSQTSQSTTNSATSGLSSLWDNNPTPQPSHQVPQSLRPGRGRPNTSSPFDSGRPNMAGQRSYAGSSTPPPGSSSSNVSTADKLRQRLGRGTGGARTTSPANQSAFAPPSQPTSQPSGYSRSGGGDYEDRFAPGGMYDSGSGNRYGGGGGGRQGGDRPFMAANAPWASNESEFSGGISGGFSGGGRQGLPSGGGRRGLPSGPRMR